MAIWAISDLHLSHSVDKPMDVFGGHWEDHASRIEENWKARVAPEDTVLVAGDISWAMSWEQALADLEWIHLLPGKKILTRGNHDYWWKKIKWMRQNMPDSLYPLQNDSVEIEGRTVCGCKGYTIPISGSDAYEEDLKYFERERARLRLSLESTKDRKQTIVMIHYPPFIDTATERDFTDILQTFDVSTVVYGHLHAQDARTAFSGKRAGIDYIFTSCDGIDFSPVPVGIPAP